jgi:WD40 repeat protein
MCISSLHCVKFIDKRFKFKKWGVGTPLEKVSSEKKNRHKKKKRQSKMSLNLNIKSVIGFNGKLWFLFFARIFISFFVGKVAGALSYTPCGRYIVYPLGSFIVLKNLVTNKEAFFDGHTQDVSCVAMSHYGDRLASGQFHFSGVKVLSHYCPSFSYLFFL